MFERPTKGDLDRSLSLLMHEAHRKVLDECNRIKADAIKAGALQSNRVIIIVATAADAIHNDAMAQAKPILLDFIERMQLSPTEITGWARPQLENLGNSVLSGIPPNGFPADQQRTVHQYRTVFQQRLDGVLAGDGPPLQHALRTCAQIGICALKVLNLVFGEQFERRDFRQKIDQASVPF